MKMKPVVLLKQIIGAIGILLALLINPACSTQGEEVVTPPNPSDKVGPLVAGWNQGEIALLQSLWLGSLPELPLDPTNAVSDNEEAAALGHKLFFDTRLSRDGDISCATLPPA